MYKDEIYKRWTSSINQKEVKFKLLKKHKHYIDKPYIAPNTIDATIMDEEEIRILIQKKLDEKFREYISIVSIIDKPLMFRDSHCVYETLHVIAIEPLFQPTVIGTSDVYKIDGIDAIRHLKFCNVGTCSIEDRLPEIFKYQINGRQLLHPANPMFMNNNQAYLKTLINSYYGMSTYNTNNDNYTQISVMINNNWKVHAIVFTSKSAVMEMIHSMYKDDLVTFETYANETLSYLDIQRLVENGILFSNHEYRILHDVLIYNKPCKFRRELFKYLENQQTISYYEYYADKVKERNGFVPLNDYFTSLSLEKIVSYRNDIMGFIRQYRVQLLSAMNKYGDIIDNTEDIGL